jgi:hypothetical protein
MMRCRVVGRLIERWQCSFFFWSLSRTAVLKQPWERAFFCLAGAIASVEHETVSKSIPHRAMARTTGHAVIFREKNSQHLAYGH